MIVRAFGFSTILLVTLAAMSCRKASKSGGAAQASQTAPDILDTYRNPVIQLHGQTISLPNEFQNPTAIAVNGNALWILDHVGTKKSLVAISAVTGAPVATLPSADSDRIDGAWSLALRQRADGGVWLFDASHHKMLLVVPSRRNPNELAIAREIALQSKIFLTSPKWRDRATLVTPGFFPSGRLGVFDSTGKFVRSVGPTPAVASPLPVSITQHAYQSTLASSNTGTRLAAVTRYADRVEIYSADGELRSVAQRPFGFDPVVRVAKSRAGPFANLEAARFGYIDVAADDRYIFALFSGRLARRYHGRENYGKYIHVFDWSGKLMRVAEIDQDAIGLALSGEVIYALGGASDPQVRSYQRRDLLLQAPANVASR